MFITIILDLWTFKHHDSAGPCKK